MYPIILALRERRVVVAGGGSVAERKIRGLRDAGARVTVISPRLEPELARLAEAGEIAWEPRPFAAGDCAGAVLVFAATGDAQVNLAVVADARAHGVPVNDASAAERGDFRTPAVHRAGPLTVTVDSSGLSPTFTTRIRDELALQFDARYGRAAATLGALRERVLAVVPPERRAGVMRHFAGRDIDDLAAMKAGAIEHEVERALDTVAGVQPGVTPTLVCASRASALAMIQTRSVMAKLAAAGIASTVVTVTTTGDAVQDRPIASIGGDGLFVKELERALRERRADFAVHSCKDLPSTLADDMTIAITGREDPRDVFCSERWASFEALPPGSRVGTSSPRRRAQLAALRTDLRYDDIRGNVDTRLRKLRDGEYDAIVLAAAGLRRLGLAATHTVPFAEGILVPAVAQGALAIEMRRGDPNAARLGALLADPVAELAVRAERAFLRTLRGGCQVPAGAHATISADATLRLHAAIAAPDGSTVIRGERELRAATLATAEATAVELALEMLDGGGAALIGETGAAPLLGSLFLLPRTVDRPSRIAAALREAGAEVVEATDRDTLHGGLAGRIPTMILFPSSGAVRAIADELEAFPDTARPLVAAMGPASAAAADAAGWPADVVAPDADIGSFVQTVTRFVLENG